MPYTKDPCFDRNATQHMLSTSLPAVWGHELKRRGRSKAERVAVAEVRCMPAVTVAAAGGASGRLLGAIALSQSVSELERL